MGAANVFCNKNHLISIVNAITFSRFLWAFAVTVAVLLNLKSYFVIFALAGLISDSLDGLLARYFRITSDFGRKIDALADYFFYPPMLAGSLVSINFDWMNKWPMVVIPAILFVLPKFIGWCLRGGYPALHLVSWKITIYFSLLWIGGSLLTGFDNAFLVVTNIAAVVASMEEVAIYLFFGGKEINNKISIFQLIS